MSVNIVLTGLMGSGKTTVGKLLTKKIKGYTLVDVDDVLQDLEGITITEIFETKGEEYFRNLEKEVISELAQEENLIISLGGGAYEDSETRDNLAENGVVFYLKAGADTLYDRIKDDNSRPLLACEDPKSKLEELLTKREPNYLKSDYVIETDGLEPDDIAEEIVKRLES